MNRFARLFCVCVVIAVSFASPIAFAAKTKNTTKKSAPSAATLKAQADARFATIVVDAYSGTVLQEHQADKVLYPASLTKIMTMFMVFEALDKKKISLNQNLTVSSQAAGMAPSKIGLRPGQTITVENALYALATKSANDAAVILAEGLGGGSETQFARMMTERAQQIGMVNTNFRNASGLPNRYQTSSARDMALLARTLLARYPEYYHYFSTREFTYNGVTFRNHNKLLGKYPGLDGIKTGFINASGFNLVASSERNGRRLIGVIFGGTSSQSRNNKMISLLDKGFEDAANKKIRLASNDPGRKNNKTKTVSLPLPAEKPTVENIEQNKNEDLKSAKIEPEKETKKEAEKRIDTDLPSTNINYDKTANSDTSDDQQPPLDDKVSVADKGTTSYWSIQVGAYNDQKGSENAIKSVRKIAPDILGDAAASIVPITTGRGTLYRARLAGLGETEAHKACAAVQKENIPCMPLRSSQ